MKPRGRPTHDVAEGRMNELLDQACRRAWEGPDQSPRVEAFLRGIKMNAKPKLTFSRSVLLLIGVGTLAGGSLAAAVTHTLMSRHATLITDDGKQYNVELLEGSDGASGRFVADDGTVFEIDAVDGAGQSQVTVDVTEPQGGTSTVELDDGSRPTVRTAPGQTATIRISKPTDAGSSKGQESADDPGE